MVFIFSSKSVSLTNRNLMPSLCVSRTFAKGVFSAMLLFHDDQRVAQSSLFEETTYSFELYHVMYNGAPSFRNRVENNDLFKILPPKLVAKKESVLLKNLIIASNLNQGKYMLALNVKQKSRMCQEPNECVDESNLRTRFQCVKCNKLVTVFNVLKKAVIEKNTGCSLQSSSLTIDIKPDIDYKSLNEVNFDCAKKSEFYPNIKLASDQNPHSVYSFVLPPDFDLSKLMLPLFGTYEEELSECEMNGKMWEVMELFLVLLSALPVLVFCLYNIYAVHSERHK